MKMREEESKKILVISPVPTHPQNAGNRIFIFKRLKYLQKKGYLIHFVLDNRGPWSSYVKRAHFNAMKKEWDEFFLLKHPASYFFLCFVVARVASHIRRRSIFLHKLLKVFIPNGFPLFLFYRRNETANPHNVDWRYHEDLDSFLIGLHKKYHYDRVLVQYIFLSRALTVFDETVVKVLDTHDVFSFRNEKFAKWGLSDTDFSVTSEEETKALNRAHVVLAIQQEEKYFFESLTDRPVIEIGHVIENKKLPEKKEWSKYLLFVGSKNTSNIDGMNYFLKEILPLIHRKIPDIKVLLVGQISKHITHRSVKKIGEIESLDAVYSLADIVINPVRVGTGLKIKTVEALAYSKPFVGTPEAVSGLLSKDALGKPFLVAKTPEEFSHHVIHLYEDRNLYDNLAHQAYQFILEYNERTKEAYRRVFP